MSLSISETKIYKVRKIFLDTDNRNNVIFFCENDNGKLEVFKFTTEELEEYTRFVDEDSTMSVKIHITRDQTDMSNITNENEIELISLRLSRSMV